MGLRGLCAAAFMIWDLGYVYNNMYPEPPYPKPYTNKHHKWIKPGELQDNPRESRTPIFNLFRILTNCLESLGLGFRV